MTAADATATRLAAAFALFALGPLASATDVAVRLVDAGGGRLADAAVWLTPLDAPTPAGGGPYQASIDQVDREFVPPVTAVPVGARLDFPNSDNIRHQVYSFSPAKRFELKLYAGREAPPVTVDQAGIVVLGCNIHDHMIAWVVVVDTPFVGVTDVTGEVALRQLPPGRYELHVYHPGQADGEQLMHEITLAGAAQGLELTVDAGPLPGPIATGG